MDVNEAIGKRRAYRSLERVEITDDLIRDLADAAIRAPSCFNNQPVRYVFVHDKEVLSQMHDALSEGNAWVKAASMIIAVFSKPDDDCVIKDRIYHQFDVGLATSQLILRATELGLVAHPIAGYSPKKVAELLGIPDEYQVITLVIVGKHSVEIRSVLSDSQVRAEKQRPERKNFEEFAFINKYKK